MMMFREKWVASALVAIATVLVTGPMARAQGGIGQDGRDDRVVVRDGAAIGAGAGDAFWFVDATETTGFGDGVAGIEVFSQYGLMTDFHMLGDVNNDGYVDKIRAFPDPSGNFMAWETDLSTATTFGDGITDIFDSFGGTNLVPLAYTDVDNADGDFDADTGIDKVSFIHEAGFTSWFTSPQAPGSSFGGPALIPLMGDVDGDGQSDRVIDTSNGLIGSPTFHASFSNPASPFFTLPGGGVDVGNKAFGAQGAVPNMGDIDGDGFDDQVVAQPSAGPGSAWNWFVDLNIAGGLGDGAGDLGQIATFGGDVATDVALLGDVWNTEIPEPGTLALAALAMVGLASRRR